MTPQEALTAFRWYHQIEIEPGLVTQPKLCFTVSWDLISEYMAELPLAGANVLDIGTRDGKWAFAAEKAGAANVFAFDNDLSPAALWLKEHWRSKVEFQLLNLYELAETPKFDVVMFFGVLYHLRYPFWGLRKALRSLREGGILAIETGLLTVDFFESTPLLYCPVDDSPYEASSCTFFNRLAMETTLKSMGARLDKCYFHPTEEPYRGKIKRAFIIATKVGDTVEHLRGYWDGTHNKHD